MLLLLAISTLLVWIPLSVWVAAGLRSIQSLRELPKPEFGVPLPRVSVVVAARDEAEAVEDSITSFLDQAYPDLEIVAVNDRSSDGTGAILDRLAEREERLKVVHIESLPNGWLGKNYALHEGTQRASGEVILLTDADVVLEPSALARAVAYLERERLDHVAVGADARVPGFWGTAFAGFFFLAFAIYVQSWRVRDPDSRAHVGIGAFNLVRAEAYRAVGGHERIAMRPDEDLKLGKILKQAGFRQDFLFAEGMARVDWYPGVQAMIWGLEKNSFAALDYNLPLTLAAAATGWVFNAWPWIALLVTSGVTWWLNAGVIACMLVAWSAHLRGPSVRLRHFVAYPVAATLFTYTVLRSAYITLRQGGIRWRGTLYPLSELRENRV